MVRPGSMDAAALATGAPVARPPSNGAPDRPAAKWMRRHRAPVFSAYNGRATPGGRPLPRHTCYSGTSNT